MRLSDPEREQLLEELARHAAVGSLEVAELERRVELVSRAVTRDEAAEAFADLPPLPSRAGAGGGGERSGGERVGGASRRLWRARGHGEADAPAADWRPTSERFRDPGSGQVMRVWIDAAGGRHYVADGPG